MKYKHKVSSYEIIRNKVGQRSREIKKIKATRTDSQSNHNKSISHYLSNKFGKKKKFPNEGKI